MIIQKCKRCGTELKYKTIWKSMWSFDTSVNCSNCGSPHEATWVSRFASSALIILPVYIKNSIRTLENRPLVYIVILVYFVIIIALWPFIIRYKLKDGIENK